MTSLLFILSLFSISTAWATKTLTLDCAKSVMRDLTPIDSAAQLREIEQLYPQILSAKSNQDALYAYKAIGVHDRAKLLARVAALYFPSVELKNTPGRQRPQAFELNRRLSTILNLEAHRLGEGIRSREEFEAAFTQFNQLLGANRAIDFQTTLSISNLIRAEISNTPKVMTWYEQTKARFQNSETDGSSNKSIIAQIDQLLAGLKQDRRESNMKVWLGGSVSMGRGLIGVSDLDISTQLHSATFPYFLTETGNWISKTKVLTAIHATIPLLNPTKEVTLVNAPWIIEVSKDGISVLIFDLGGKIDPELARRIDL